MGIYGIYYLHLLMDFSQVKKLYYKHVRTKTIIFRQCPVLNHTVLYNYTCHKLRMMYICTYWQFEFKLYISSLSSYEVAITSAQDPNFTVIPVYNREKV